VDDERDTAFHEAAHAVVGTVLGARVLSLELRSGPPSCCAQVTDLSAPSGESPDHGLVRLIAYKLAGPIAQSIAEGSSTSFLGEPGWLAATTVMTHVRQPEGLDDETDEGAAARLVLDHFGSRDDDAAAAVDHLALNVETWVRDHWSTIELVAVNLLRHRRLTGDQFRSLVSVTMPAPHTNQLLQTSPMLPAPRREELCRPIRAFVRSYVQ